jgi:O-antigen/teichoic acid export membrane protein
LAAVLAALSPFIAKLLVAFLKIQPHFYKETLFVFYIGIITFGVSNALSPFSALQSGLQLMDISNKIVVGMSVLNIIGTVFCLENNYGLSGLMVNNAAIVLLTGLCNAAIAYRLLPGLTFSFHYFDKEILKKLFKFGYKLQVTTIANLFHFQVDKLLLAYLLDVKFVAYYTIASQLASRVRDLPLMLISAVFPAASELEANTDRPGLKKLYFRSLKYVVLVGLPVSAATVLFAAPFIRLWLGSGYGQVVLTLQIMVTAYFFNILSGPGFTILNGIGLPKYGMMSSTLAAGLNLVLSLLLLLMIGYFGVVAGTAVSMTVGSAYFILKFHQVMDIPVRGTAEQVLLKPLAACALSCGAVYFLMPRFERIGWKGLIGLGLLYSLIAAVTLLLARCFDDFDKKLMTECLLKAKRRCGIRGGGGE